MQMLAYHKATMTEEQEQDLLFNACLLVVNMWRGKTSHRIKDIWCCLLELVEGVSEGLSELYPDSKKERDQHIEDCLKEFEYRAKEMIQHEHTCWMEEESQGYKKEMLDSMQCNDATSIIAEIRDYLEERTKQIKEGATSSHQDLFLYALQTSFSSCHANTMAASFYPLWKEWCTRTFDLFDLEDVETILDSASSSASPALKQQAPKKSKQSRACRKGKAKRKPFGTGKAKSKPFGKLILRARRR